MKIIKDPVHGFIEVEDWALRLVDAPVVQRLRYIKQLGFSYLVYPGANHTRFEHSLGTMFLAGLLARELALPESDRRLITAAAVLHDIGHGPFSHSIEPLMKEVSGAGHNRIRELLTDPDIDAGLAAADVEPGDVATLMEGKHPLSGILESDLDVDRMDYLLRDAHYTGVPYGTVDAHRLIRHIILDENRILLGENGVNAAESLLIARTLMRPAVYFHHVSRIAETMFLRAVLAHLQATPHGAERLLMRLDDGACVERLLGSPSPVARDLMARIHSRRLYKRALIAGDDRVHSEIRNRYGTVVTERKASEAIAEIAGIASHEVLVDVPPFPEDLSMGVMVKNRNEVVPLSRISPLITTLNATRRSQWLLGVYTVPEKTQVVAEAASMLLGVRPVTRQDQLPI
jgi:HD superfamily phosphohydrolase